jgi:copper chaperone CopZ
MAKTYSVPGISCGHCQAAIEGELLPLDGVESVNVDLENKLVTVEGSISEDQVRAAIDEAGYEVAGVQ